MNEKQEVPKTGTFVADQRGGNLSTYDLPGIEQDKIVAINAIHALLETA